MPIEGRQPHASSGLFRERGQWGNLPTGEAYLAPIEGASNGVVVVDGSMAGIGMVRQPIRIAVEDGYATTITGGEEGERLIALLEPHGEDARTVAEFGIGTNDKAILTGIILEDEKVMGTIHIAFGDNKSMGGSVRVASHLDGLIKQPTVWFDDDVVMRDGELLVKSTETRRHGGDLVALARVQDGPKGGHRRSAIRLGCNPVPPCLSSKDLIYSRGGPIGRPARRLAVLSCRARRAPRTPRRGGTTSIPTGSGTCSSTAASPMVFSPTRRRSRP